MDFLSDDGGPSSEDYVQQAKVNLDNYWKDHYRHMDDLVYPQTMLLFAVAEQLRIVTELLVEINDGRQAFIDALLKFPQTEEVQEDASS